MSELTLISPILDNFLIGEAFSEHNGVRCYPAMEKDTNEKYIVKVISVPAAPSQTDALLLSGAYDNKESALTYYKSLADNILQEVSLLSKLCDSEGYIAYKNSQLSLMESGYGYNIYLLASYKRTLEAHLKNHKFTHLQALNLALDLCSALSACRRNGYVYVDLKPSNVYVTDENVCYIGDLGFIRLDSLQYAFLPDRYLSIYTPPEIRDAFSALNPTIDVYAVGLILYQIYNGLLPFNDTVSPGDKIPAPQYADSDLSEIILKACSPCPEDRWEDPMQMGQAIVHYMQCVCVKDTPIVSGTTPEDNSGLSNNISREITSANADLHTDTDSSVLSDDEFYNSSFLSSLFAESGVLDTKELNFDSFTYDTSDILSRVDELAALHVPAPVIPPEYIEVSLPESAVVQKEDSNADIVKVLNEISVETSHAEVIIPKEDIPKPARKRDYPWIKYVIISLIILALLSGFYYFYKNYYLLPIESISASGSKNTLTVSIATNVDESLLHVVCYDAYGNQFTAPILDRKAVFNGLVPNTSYSIKLVTDSFHKLTGNTTTTYSTPVQSNIVQFDAVNGISDGSVILSFTVEGPDCKEWTVEYSADGEPVRSAVLDSHMIALTGLTLGKEYRFKLIPSQQLHITGNSEITFVAGKPIRAENLEIISCMDNTLIARWTGPNCDDIINWSVRCTSSNYNKTILTTDCFVTFYDLDHTAEYRVEVKAVGMSMSQIASIPANSITATNIQQDLSDSKKIVLNWSTSTSVPPEGWILRYSIAGIDTEEVLTCKQNSAIIDPIIPNATYHIQLEDIHGNLLLGSYTTIKTGLPAAFLLEIGNFKVGYDDLSFKMCKAPDLENWDQNHLTATDYTTEFQLGKAASFIVELKQTNQNISDTIQTMFVVRDQTGTPVSNAHQTNTWHDMWVDNYYRLDIPNMPTVRGEYSIEIYFNGGLAAVESFAII